MKNIKKEITFFYNEGVEKIHWTNLVSEAKNRGYITSFSNDMNEKAEIGFYCSDTNKPENSKLSLVMLHGMDQGRTRWPNMWRDWPWHKFDIGLLPGKTWVDRWKTVSQDPYAHPKIGVFEVGSPKADEIFTNMDNFKKEISSLSTSLNLPFDKTVLYAPSFETDNKQIEIIKLLEGTDTNILIKHWLISDDDKNNFPDIWNNIQNACKQITEKQSHIKVLSPKLSIMTCLGLCDLLVTDESSVAYEALLLNKKAFTLKNWGMRTNNLDQPRPVNPPEGIVSKISEEKFKEFILNYNRRKDSVEMHVKREANFSHLGCSSKNIIDIVDSVLTGDKFKNMVISSKKVKKSLIPIRFFIRLMSKIFPKNIRLQIRSFMIQKKLMGSYFGKPS